MSAIPWIYRRLRGFGIPHAAAIIYADPDYELENDGGGGGSSHLVFDEGYEDLVLQFGNTLPEPEDAPNTLYFVLGE